MVLFLLFLFSRIPCDLLVHISFTFINSVFWKAASKFLYLSYTIIDFRLASGFNLDGYAIGDVYDNLCGYVAKILFSTGFGILGLDVATLDLAG